MDLATKVQSAAAVAGVATALGTLYLAFVTFRLARSTKEMADVDRQVVAINRSTLEEIQAERVRSVRVRA